MNRPGNISFNDISAQRKRIEKEIDKAIQTVLVHGKFILGPEVFELEKQLADYTKAKYVISCASGTDALLLVLMAKNIGPGDAVFVPTFTFVSTAEVVSLLGATPVFVDVDIDTCLIDINSLERAIQNIKKSSLNPKGIIPVDLFGQAVDYESINGLAKQESLFVLADAAQSFGATRNGNKVGTLAQTTATSFFPAKPLGCYGDGGAIFTDDEDLANKVDSLRVHGKGEDKYDNNYVGINGRLDTIQAAILIEKLRIFDDEIKVKQKIAKTYSDQLSNTIKVPKIEDDADSVWAQYTIQVENRDHVKKALMDHGIPFAIYYPRPLHLQKAYIHYPRAAENLVNSEKLSSNVLSLPMHPYLEDDTQKYIIDVLNKATG